jgi:protein-S-isoprenylcysteine O-methyltransferase Ste14
MSLLIRNVLFTIIVPGTGAVVVPWLILGGKSATDGLPAWIGAVLIGAGLVLYLWCLWLFAKVGRGTPGPWDAPRHLVVVGPYRWVRNPIYLAAFAVIAGQAALFASLPVLVWGVVAAVFEHVFVVAYEEPTLEATFGAEYTAYRTSVRRWLPTPPRT